MHKWPHAPARQMLSGAVMLTAGTYQKEHLFSGEDRLRLLQNKIFTLAEEFEWELQAWAIFSNHYHLIANVREDCMPDKFVRRLHGSTSFERNKLDNSLGRKVWHNFRDTNLTNEGSYLARMHYVYENPVKHGIVSCATAYEFCSATWFEQNANPTLVKRVLSTNIDLVNVDDDY